MNKQCNSINLLGKMNNNLIIMVSCGYLAILASCGGEQVEITGIAGNWKMGPAIQIGQRIVFVDGKEWSEEMIGKMVTIKGVIERRDDMPVFLNIGSGIQVSGIPCSSKEEMEKYKWREVINGKVISAQQVDSAEASTTAVPPSAPSGSPR